MTLIADMFGPNPAIFGTFGSLTSVVWARNGPDVNCQPGLDYAKSLVGHMWFRCQLLVWTWNITSFLWARSGPNTEDLPYGNLLISHMWWSCGWVLAAIYAVSQFWKKKAHLHHIWANFLLLSGKASWWALIRTKLKNNSYYVSILLLLFSFCKLYFCRVKANENISVKGELFLHYSRHD